MNATSFTTTKRSSEQHRLAEGLIVPHELYQSLGRTDEERQSAYRQLCRAQVVKVDVEAIRNTTNKVWVLGDSRFGAKVAALTERRAVPLPRGRPKREMAY
jgi:putative transposase